MKNGRKIIAMVDDNITTLSVARNVLMEKYDIFTVPSGKKLFKLLESTIPDLILLDVDMPGMNGYEIIKILKSNERTAHIPIIFLTAMVNVEDEMMGLNLGAIDYITKPFSSPLLLKRIEVHLLVEEQKKELELYNTNLQRMVKKRTRTVFELQNVVLKAVAELVEFRDDITGRHIGRTQNYLQALMNCMLRNGVYAEEISSWDGNLLLLSSQLHDVGKIAIRDDVLLKPAKLTAEEFEEIKKHTVIGAGIIRKIAASAKENAFLRHAETFAISHHEKWDGTGYPGGLKAENIPLMGRLMAIVDVYDALTNDRPYKKALSHEQALKIIESESGTHFDPLIVSVFLENAEEIKNAALITESSFNIEDDLAAFEMQRAFSKTLEEIRDWRDGINTNINPKDRTRSYITILINALLRHGKYTQEIASWDIDLLILSSKLHDVGKMIIHDDILHKPHSLTGKEFEKIKEHTEHGILLIRKVGEGIGERLLTDHAEALVASHHEKWDGTGYPAGLTGEAIPLPGRLMAIIDVYDALTNDRPYKKAATHEEAVAIIQGENGTRFDPYLVKIFLEHEKEFKAVLNAEPRAV